MVSRVIKEVDDRCVEIINVSKICRIGETTSSKGNQIKWFLEGKIIKLNMLGYEDIAEILSSHLLHYSNLKQGIDFIDYYPCVIVEDGKCLGNGCYSYDYTLGGKYRDISSGRLLKKKGKSFGIGYYDFIDFVEDDLGFNIKKYLDRVLCFDAIVRNEDRHFHNINILTDNEGNLISIPIYDNGCGCMSDCISYPLEEDFFKNFESIHSKPFRFNFEDQIVNAERLVLDVNGFFNSVNIYSDKAKRALRTIEEGLLRTKNLAWEGL